MAYIPTGNVTISSIGAGGAGGTVTLNTGAGVSSIGSAGSYLVGGGITSSGTSSTYTTTWASPNTNWNSTNGKPVLTMPHGKDEVILEKSATLQVNGNIVMNGVDLEERIKTIERILTIPERDVKLEAKHPKLKKLYDEYIAALGKYRTFEAIKGEDDGTT